MKIHLNKSSHLHTHACTDKQIRHTDTVTDRQTEKETGRQRQTDRQTDRQSNFLVTNMAQPRKERASIAVSFVLDEDAPPQGHCIDRHGSFVGCLTSQQQARMSRGRICSDNFTCCHTEIQVADQTFYLIQSQYTDTDQSLLRSKAPGIVDTWQGRHWSANFELMA